MALMFDIDPGANHLCTTNILRVARVDETPEGCLEAGSELGKLVRGEDCVGLVVRLHRTLEPDGSGRFSILPWQGDLFLFFFVRVSKIHKQLIKAFYQCKA